MRFIIPAAIYFATVFGAGFLLAMIRIPFLIPQFGVRIAELIEMPVMLAVVFFSARRLARTRLGGYSRTEAMIVGIVAFVFLIGAEIGLGMILSGRGPIEILLDKDPVSGTVYYLSLIVFAILPSLLTGATKNQGE